MAQELVDRARHADAFANADQLENNPLPSLVARLGIESILDVGCGVPPAAGAAGRGAA
ncbi:hypothetical protein LP419_21465 [Massilia sp. H-1]|nr:hypothetical protein LP419_21465 [Massilia sp. H-1]